MAILLRSAAWYMMNSTRRVARGLQTRETRFCLLRLLSMNELVKAHLNLHAVLPNLEDLVSFDTEAAELIQRWKRRVWFVVRGGPSVTISFQRGRCQVLPGAQGLPSVVLGFTSPGHLNAMFEGSAKPVPLWGLHHLGWLANKFPKLTDRLEHYLRPDDTVLADADAFGFVLRCQLRTAVRGLKYVAELDPEMRSLAAHTPNGVAELSVLPDGPVVGIEHQGGTFTPLIDGLPAHPNVRAVFRNGRVAFDLLNGRGDAYAALGRCDLVMRGYLPLIDNLLTLLDHMSRYLN